MAVENEAERRRAGAPDRVSLAQLEAVIAARRLRAELFGMELGSPGWSLLLVLFRASLERRAVGARRLAVEAGVGVAVAGRWMERLVGAGLVERVVDPGGAALFALRLTEAGAEAMEDYFAALLVGWRRG